MFIKSTDKFKQRRYLFSFVFVSLIVLVLNQFSLGNAQSIAEIQSTPINPQLINSLYYQEFSSQSYNTQTHPEGLLPLPVDLSYLTSINKNLFKIQSVQGTAPTTYDLRTLNRVTPVRDQGQAGSCWAFATYASLESNLLPTENRDFSENNLKNTHGFDLGPSDGGNSFMSCAYLARWKGPINESDDPYNALSGISPTNLPVQKHVQDVLFLPDRSSATDNDLIKQMVQTYGAVYTTMCYDNYYYNSQNKTYNDPNSSQNNHAVAIVGWDDNYNRSLFSPYVPAGNGAFIVKNSWGTGWGQSGYFYVSYYDLNFTRASAVFVKPELTTNFNHIYQYDPLGLVSALGYGSSTSWMANVFTATASDYLTATSWYTLGANTTYQISVYVNANNGPISGNLVTTQSGSITMPGYHTIHLNSPVQLTVNRMFSVVVKIISPSYPYMIPYEYPVSGYSSAATAQPGQSFISPDGSSWQDLTSWQSNANVCLKAFTTSSASVTAVPIISQQPANLTVNMGSTASFGVVATGIPTPTYQWRLNGANISGATAATLTISNVQPINAGTYSVVVSNSQASVISQNAILSVNQPPVITQQPKSQVVNRSGSVSFNVVATGYPTPTYQWRFNGTNISNATSATLTISNTQSSNIGLYSVAVTNSQGTVVSENATLNIYQSPVITQQPTNQIINRGNSATFTVVATGYPTPTYQWRFNNTNITNATSSTLTLTNVQTTNVGTYSIVITNSQGTVTSTAVTLNIYQSPVITQQPSNQSVNQNGTAAFTVVATGYPTPTYQWRFNGANLSNATLATLTIPNVQPVNGGSYSVVVSNSQGNATSTNATLSINQPATITQQPINQTVNRGAAATFSVVATGFPAPTYQWYFNGTKITSAISSTLTINNAQTTNVGSYSVVVSNSQKAVTSTTATLNIYQSPEITKQPINQSVNQSGTVAFTVVATGYPTPTYQWRFNCTNISGATSATLTIPNVQPVNVGLYSVVVSNNQGTATSTNATLNINQPATITQQPTNQTVNRGAAVSFNVTAAGFPSPTYQWYFNGVKITNAVSATLTLNNVQSINVGSYSVVVSNSQKTVTSTNVTLNIYQLPEITKQLTNQAVNQSGTATFTVGATGYPSPTYQWRFNGTNISGATSATLTIPSVQPVNAGLYSVVASNSQGTATSANATLNINQMPSITQQPINQSVNRGGSVTFTVTTAGFPTPTYQWRLNGTNITNATSASLTISNAQSTNIGLYSVVVKNSQGTITSNIATLIMNQAPLINQQPKSMTVNPGGTATFTNNFANSNSK